MATIGSKIREARRAAGFNAERFAVALDVSYPTIQRWESGKTTPSVRTLMAIASLVDKPLSYFINDEAELVA